MRVRVGQRAPQVLGLQWLQPARRRHADQPHQPHLAPRARRSTTASPSTTALAVALAAAALAADALAAAALAAAALTATLPTTIAAALSPVALSPATLPTAAAQTAAQPAASMPPTLAIATTAIAITTTAIAFTSAAIAPAASATVAASTIDTSFSPSPRTVTVTRATAAFTRTTWSRAGLHRHDLARVCSSRRRDLRQRCAGTSTGAHSRRRGPSRPGARRGNVPSDALAPFAAAAFACRATPLVAAALASHPACPHVPSAGCPGRLACHHDQN